MADPTQDITSAALALPEGERLALATRLLDSLQGPEDPDADAAWLAEAVRRIREVNEGRVATLSTDEVLGAARAAIKRK
ncbi:MAG: addiction module protein [Deltaproteobacteria bacterium]|nr:addiction module protein [Deltaproteobacteria bacterium]